MKIAMRLATQLKRMRSARKFKVPYWRAADFVLPAHLQIGSDQIALSVPNEVGQSTAFVEIFLDDVYNLRMIATHLGRAPRILDVGANVGFFALAARSLFPGASIHSYEPNASLKPHLEKHAGQGHFEFFIEAVGAQSGFGDLNASDTSILGAVNHAPGGTIPITSFARAIDRIGTSVDLVKLDCEGAEWEILACRADWRKVRYVAMEYHLPTPGAHSRAYEAIEKIGFEMLSPASNEPVDYGVLLAGRLE